MEAFGNVWMCLACASVYSCHMGPLRRVGHVHAIPVPMHGALGRLGMPMGLCFWAYTQVAVGIRRGTHDGIMGFFLRGTPQCHGCMSWSPVGHHMSTLGSPLNFLKEPWTTFYSKF